MVSKSKLYAQLDRLEEELFERIVPHLTTAAAGNNDLVFCASDFNSLPPFAASFDAETESLIQLGRKILALAEKLDETSAGSIAERLCWYCVRWGKSGNAHQKAAQELAQAFLREIDNGRSNLTIH